ncbi:hypothetical protein E2C01_054517 [Portunus trituberculatus]|uniref:Uncharacterized protein n=1 Tax=Portunus trituberculatus TaxID=210409 RepID=A0A5B7GNV7_PORTR|nr:hypothetical protein [Portunus trituberculatus]
MPKSGPAQVTPCTTQPLTSWRTSSGNPATKAQARALSFIPLNSDERRRSSARYTSGDRWANTGTRLRVMVMAIGTATGQGRRLVVCGAVRAADQPKRQFFSLCCLSTSAFIPHLCSSSYETLVLHSALARMTH